MDDTKNKFTAYLVRSLSNAKCNYVNKKEEIFRMYQPLLKSRAYLDGKFDEDLYQELSVTLLECVEKFWF